MTENQTSPTEETKTYELMFILPGDLTEEKASAAFARIKKDLEEIGSKITYEEQWGRRDLAYPIQKKIRGYYFVLHFSLTPSLAPEVEEFARLDKEIIRHLLVIWPEEITPVDYSKSRVKFGEEPPSSEKPAESESKPSASPKPTPTPKPTPSKEDKPIQPKPQEPTPPQAPEPSPESTPTEKPAQPSPEEDSTKDDSPKEDSPKDSKKLDDFLDSIDNLGI